MTKNSGRKKAARQYQQEHPGTTFPEAMRAVARPTARPFSMPDGYILLDQEGVPTMFDPVAYTADFNASLLAADASDALFPQANGAQLTPEQTEAIKLRQAEMVVSLVGELNEHTATAEVQAAISDMWQTRSPAKLAAEMGLSSSADWPSLIMHRKLDGVEYDETERAELASRVYGKDPELADWGRALEERAKADYARAPDERAKESWPRDRITLTENFMRHNEVIQAMTTHTVENDSAT